MNMPNKLNILRRMELEPYANVRWDLNEIKKLSPVFRILYVTASFFNQPQIDLSFDFEDSPHADARYFSLLIGRNGMGKSLFLRAILDFIIDARLAKPSRNNNSVSISSVEYELANHRYRIERDGRKISFRRDGKDVRLSGMQFPFIIASTMGMFDKFPVNRVPGNSRNARYDENYYKYVGPKAGNNMFISKTNVLLQILTAMGRLKNSTQLKKMVGIMNYIGYDANIVFSFKLKDNAQEIYERKESIMDINAISYYKSLASNEVYTIHIRLDSYSLSKAKNQNLEELNRLRQEGFLASFHCSLFKRGIGEEVDCNNLSSGEFNMLCIVLSVILSAGQRYLLILLDEPEISQHPNWQVSIIEKLDEALSDYGCHFLIATHCHYLVSNLPLKRSNLMMIEEKDGREIQIEPMPSETYGWSSEEVLLKVFGMATDRSRYLADIVGKLMTKIGNNDITPDDVKKEVNFLRQVSEGLSEVDPMKRIIDTIINEFSKDE